MSRQNKVLSIISRSNPENDFELLKQIGSGTYGDVYKARMNTTGRLCAMKIIKLEPGEDFNIIQLEIGILSECKHPNIVGYFGSYLRRDKLWIAMEFCGGGSLQDIYLLQGALKEQQIAFVCREMLNGLHYLHSQNKMHRDIKGANILLTDDGEVKLADFGIAAKMTKTLMKRSTFIGTPYWMAPEVAAVEKKGAYDQKCDIWSVGITAIELAEKKPPNYDIHPMSALLLMTKKKFVPPTLKSKSGWSPLFHDFLKITLQKDAKRRPNADELLKVKFVSQNDLGEHLMIPLVKVFTASIDTGHSPPMEDPTEEVDPIDVDDVVIPDKETFKRIRSMKKQISGDLSAHNLQLNPQSSHINKDAEPTPSWMLVEASRKDIRRVNPDSNKKSPSEKEPANGFYSKVNKGPPPAHKGPPPANKGPPPANKGPPPEPPPKPSTPPQESPPPLPPKGMTNKGPHPQPHPQPSSQSKGPPIPPHPPKPPKGSSEPRAYFSKIFNGCPLHLTCAQTWTHPHTGIDYAFLGTEEGLYSLQLTQNPDPIMEQVLPRSIHWSSVFDNTLISIAGKHNHLFETNLILLKEDKPKWSSQRIPINRRIPDSRGCIKCGITRNPFDDQKFLVAAVPKGILLLRWFPPRCSFMLDKFVEVPLPNPLTVVQPFVSEGEDCPVVCVGVYEGEKGRVHFDTIDLNNQDQLPKMTESNNSKQIIPFTLNQVDVDTVMIGYDKYAKFVDKQGNLKLINQQASQLSFDYPSSAIVMLQDCVLSFHKHGMQGKSLLTSQVTADVLDPNKVFKLLGTTMSIIVETRPFTDPDAPSNLYVLVSDES